MESRVAHALLSACFAGLVAVSAKAGRLDAAALARSDARIRLWQQRPATAVP
ncbi:hypothetical protein IGB42_01702 [Andreprevotia sp. IGB-42]|uniref:hypothetical protein n=1 Tax=Andreprevotia sp. IGB-42 TaxID=2497473 RepID=UPI0013593B7F|nr:hypothetical protein [Andreprevotia sp. IGB-42]KAF0814022.1 hypothetical protein IGB42_01702 [Andreprevotia sp. IGB-42]